MMKRFYTMVSSKKTDEGYAIQLDGKPVKTPSGQDMAAPTKSLADAIVQEWSAQEEKVKPDTMPLTQILTTAIDKIRDREAITESLMRYLDTDLVCYWTKEPEALAKRQKEIWGQWVKWFDEHFEVPLDTTTKIDAIKQDEEAHKRVWNYIETLDDYYFTVLHIVTSLSGSLVLALAFSEGEITTEQIFEASYLEELYRGEIYNEDVHGAAPNEEAEREAFKRDMNAAREFLELANDYE
ncbi:MAG TPA: ATP12 family protein [Alphaproteobacteria bacterium]|nr:ATP12 family protein [Alphaproteobacteria bacterium]